MGSNAFGKIFTMTTWGESHGPAVGVVIDGCPAGVSLTEEDFSAALSRRAPGRHAYLSPRREPDVPKILSGVWNGMTTGTPLALMIMNQDVDSSSYDAIQHLLRPGHAQMTYHAKYGVMDERGGGRASARETVCRVMAGVVAQKVLSSLGIKTHACLKSLGALQADIMMHDWDTLVHQTYASPLFCPIESVSMAMMAYLDDLKAEGDSVGGVVQWMAEGLPAGLGDPVYEKLEAVLAKAMLSLPASKGFEVGEGFRASQMCGSAHNDYYDTPSHMMTNHAGGTLGGISTGSLLWGTVAFKPTSSIRKPQPTVTWEGDAASFELPAHARHDPCVAIRAVPVVEAMLALVLVDAILMNRCARLI